MNNRIKHLFPIMLLLISLIVTFLSAKILFDFQATTTDENSYIFEAKLFLKGRVFTTPSPLQDFFRQEQIVSNGKVFSRYPPGHSLILIPGVMLNFYNLMPIILSSLTIVVIYYSLMKLTNNILLSAIAGIITICSPFFIAISGTYLSHTSFAFFISLYLFLFIINKEEKFKNNVFACILGFVCAASFITRPYSSLLLCIPFVFYHLFICIKHNNYKNFIYFIIGSIPVISLFFLYNYICTGNPLTQTYTYYDPSQKLGFGMRYWSMFNFTPQEALSTFKNNILLLNKWLLGSPLSLILLIASIFVSRNDVWKILLINSTLFLFFGYFFFFYPGVPWLGPNYYYDSFPLLIILLFRNINYLCLKNKILIYSLFSIIVFSYIFYYPVFLGKISQDMRKWSGDLAFLNKSLKNNNIHNAVIFIKNNTSVTSPYSILINNSPFLDDDILTTHNWGSKNNLFSIFYPERKLYLANIAEDNKIINISEINKNAQFNHIIRLDPHFNNSTGKKILLPNSENFILWGRKSTDKPNHLLYGPYWPLPMGEYTCVFYIRANNVTKNKPIVKVDVCTSHGNNILSEKILMPSDFGNNKRYYKFPIDFSINNSENIETRVYFYGNADILVNKIKLIKK